MEISILNNTSTFDKLVFWFHLWDPSLSLTSLFWRGWKRLRKKKGREREREAERDFYYGKIGGEGTFADVYKKEKGKDERA
jgi:hypothetical protein